jgi:restriction system protein
MLAAAPVHMPQYISPWLLGSILVALAIAAALLQSPRVKGAIGEWGVKYALNTRLNQKKYHCLHNVLIPDGRGGLTQIDHVVISSFGLFVIETKNYSGWIFGSERDARWTVTYRSRRKESFQNPIRQNWCHIQAMETLLKLPPGNCHSIVIFTGKAVLKKGPIPGVLQSGLTRHIKSFRAPALDAPAAAELAATLRSACQTRDPKARAAHLAQVRFRRSA